MGALILIVAVIVFGTLWNEALKSAAKERRERQRSRPTAASKPDTLRGDHPRGGTRVEYRQQPSHATSLDDLPDLFGDILRVCRSMGTMTVQSETSRSTTYEVVMDTFTCTCPDFLESRTGYEVGDLRRLCKHQVSIVADAVGPDNQLLKAILANHYRKSFYRRGTMASGEPIAFGLSAGEPWIDVFTRKRRKGDRDGKYTGDYDRFGFSLDERRWSYGDGPPGAREIRSMIGE